MREVVKLGRTGRVLSILNHDLRHLEGVLLLNHRSLGHLYLTSLVLVSVFNAVILIIFFNDDLVLDTVEKTRNLRLARLPPHNLEILFLTPSSFEMLRYVLTAKRDPLSILGHFLGLIERNGIKIRHKSTGILPQRLILVTVIKCHDVVLFNFVKVVFLVAAEVFEIEEGFFLEVGGRGCPAGGCLLVVVA